MLEIKFSFEPTDYKNFNKDSLGIKRIRKIILNLYIVPNIIFSFIFSLCFSFGLFGGIYFQYWLFDVVLCIGMVIAYIFLLGFLLFNQYIFGGKATIRQQQGVNKDVIITLQDDMLTSDNGDMRSEFHWDKVKDIYNKKHSLLIFVADMQSIIIPKRIFNSEKDMDDCWNYIQDCYNKTHNNG